MNYREFVEEVGGLVRDRLGDGYSVRARQVTKNNGVARESLMICSKGDPVSPLIYLDEFYEVFRKGAPMDVIADRLTQIFQEKRNAASFNVQDFMDRARMTEHLVCRLVNREKNAGLLNDIPHRRFLNLEIVYYYQNASASELVQGKDSGSVLIRNEHLKIWDLDTETLDRCARENMPALCPSRFCSMHETMEELLGVQMPKQEEELPLYVLSSISRNYGAYWITDREVMGRIADRLAGDFYVLPSSVHECLILPASPDADAGSLLRMVREINADQVPPEELLADAVYRFSQKTRELYIAAD